MINLGKNLIVVLPLLFLLAAPSSADIIHGKIQFHNADDILLERFGFTDTGFVSVAVSSVSVTTNDLSRLGFYLLSDEAPEISYELCMLDSKSIILLFTFTDLFLPLHSSFNKSYPVKYPGYYSLHFASCNCLTQLSMDVRTELYNMDDATRRNYLSVGQTQLPSLYFIFSLIYLCISGLWLLRCFTNKNNPSFTRTHLLMRVFIITKALSLFCEYEVQQSVKVRGTPPGWIVLLYIFQFSGDVILYCVSVLIGLGYQETKKMVMMVLIPLQVIHNVVFTLVHDIGIFNEYLCYWIGGSILVDGMCCLVIIIPFFFYAKEIWTSAPFRLLFIWVSAYVTFLIMVIGCFFAFLSYKYQWVYNTVEEIQSLLVYIMVMSFVIHPVELEKEESEV